MFFLKWKKGFWLALWICLFGFVLFGIQKLGFNLVSFVSADGLMDDLFWDLLPAAQGGDVKEMFFWLIKDNLVYYAKWIMVSVSILYLTLYGFLYITNAWKEENISEQHDNLIWAVIGFAVIGIANLSMEIISVENGAIVDTQEFEGGALKVVAFIEYMLGAIAILYMFIAAMRFIMAGGDEEEINKQKKNFTWWFFGLIIVMIADTFIKVIYDRDRLQFDKDGVSEFTNQAFGVVQFILGLMLPFSILVIVLAGIFYIISMGDEQNTERALNIIKSTVIGFVIISLAYAVVYMLSPE